MLRLDHLRTAVAGPATLLLLLLLAGCGTTQPRRADETEHERDRDAPQLARPTPVARRARACEPLPWPRDLTGTASDTTTARATVDRAADRRTSRGGRFATALVVRVAGLRATADLVGRTAASGTSVGTLRWHGPAALLLDDRELRITRDRLETRPAGTTTPWTPLGSASGTALDVGRELLEHPFLLEARSATTAGPTTTIALDAPALALRAYATDERRGPVTELLRSSRRLQIDVQVRDGLLLRDRWTLDTVLPAIDPIPDRLAGHPAHLSGTTTYCADAPSTSRTS